eukprot:Nk52_evm14s1916 gene=Nk52_evmTU14s1916
MQKGRKRSISWSVLLLVFAGLVVVQGDTIAVSRGDQDHRNEGQGRNTGNAIVDQLGAVVEDPIATACPCLNKRKVKIWVAAHGSAGDGFWDLVHVAANITGRDASVVVDWQRPAQVDSLEHSATLRALADNPEVDGLVVTLAGDILVDAMNYATSKGKPVVSMNSIPKSFDFSTRHSLHLNHVAQDDFNAAVILGKEMQSLGAKKCILPVTEQLNEGVINRRKGLESVFGASNVVQIGVDISNMEGTQDTVVSTINSDPDFNCMISGGGKALPALDKAFLVTGKTLYASGFDVSEGSIPLIKEGKLRFAVDQGQIVQGAHSVLYMYLYLTTGYKVMTSFVESGPQLVGKEDIDAFQCGAQLAMLHRDSDCTDGTCKCVNQQTCPATVNCPSFSQGDVTIHVATDITTFDAWWDNLKLGISHAVRDLGINTTVSYHTSYTAVEQVAQIDSAIAAKAKGLVVTIPDDDYYTTDTKAARPIKFAVERALTAGIKVAAIHYGRRTQQALASRGLFSYIGQDETEAANLMAAKLAAQSISNIIIVTNLQSGKISSRLQAFRDKLVSLLSLNTNTDMLLVPTTLAGGVLVRIGSVDVTASRADIKAAILNRPGLQAIVSLQAAVFTQIVSALNLVDSANNFPRILFQDGSTTANPNGIPIYSFDLNEEVLNEIVKGNTAAAIDQQEYLQGYLGIYLTYMKIISNTAPASSLSTGPRVIDTKEEALTRLCAAKGKVNVMCPCEADSGWSNNVDVCYKCRPGTYAPGNSTSVCDPCPKGNVCPSYGMTLTNGLVQCPSAFTTGQSTCIDLNTDCEDYVPTKEGGFIVFEDFSKSESYSSSGTYFTLVILILFISEFFIAILWHFRRWYKRRVRVHAQKHSGAGAKNSINADMLPSFEDDGSRKESTSSQGRERKLTDFTASLFALTNFRRKYHRYGLLGAFRVSSLTFKSSDLHTQIDPSLENLYPIITVFTDLLQIGSIILAPDIEWLASSQASDYISVLAISFDWFFWVIVGAVFPWVMYSIFLITGFELTLSRSFPGRMILLPSNYLLPLGGTVLLIPAMTYFLRVFACREAVAEVLVSPILVVNDHCTMECWDETHWIYAACGGVILLIYWPLANYSAPMWQSIQVELQVMYKPLFLYIDTLLKTGLVFSRIFLRQYIGPYYAIVALIIVFYLGMSICNTLCKVPWVGNLRSFVYVVLFYVLVIVVISLPTAEKSSIWPYVLLAGSVVIFTVFYVRWDYSIYPDKIIDKNDKTRRLIREFMKNNADNISVSTMTMSTASGLDNGKPAATDENDEGVDEEFLKLKREKRAAAAASEPQEVHDWSLIEEFVMDIGNVNKLTRDEYQYFAFLFIRRSITLVDLWKNHNAEQMGTTVKRIQALYRDFHEYVDKIENTNETLDSRRRSSVAASRLSNMNVYVSDTARKRTKVSVVQEPEEKPPTG